MASNDAHSSASTRDEEFWFDNMTVIITADDVEFRLPTRFLLERIPTLAEFLPETSSQTCGDNSSQLCTTMRLKDSARDWREVLRVLMPSDGCVLMPVVRFNLRSFAHAF